MLLAAALMLAATDRPTRTGDPIGAVTIRADGTVEMQLRSVECDGTIVEGPATVGPGDPAYAATLAHLGGLAAGQTKTVRAWPTPPCPKRRGGSSWRF